MDALQVRSRRNELRVVPHVSPSFCGWKWCACNISANSLQVTVFCSWKLARKDWAVGEVNKQEPSTDCETKRVQTMQALPQLKSKQFGCGAKLDPLSIHGICFNWENDALIGTSQSEGTVALKVRVRLLTFKRVHV